MSDIAPFFRAHGRSHNWAGRGSLMHGRAGPFAGPNNQDVQWAVILPFNDAGSGVVNLNPSLGSITPTFTRATSAWTVLSNGTIGLVASGSARSYYTPAGVYRGFLCEPASTNLVKSSQSLNSADWTNVNAPTFSGGTTTLGALSLDTIGDDSGALLKSKTQVVTFAGNGSHGISFYVKQGTSTSSVVRLQGLATRMQAVITWSGSVPVVTMSTGVDLTGTPEQLGSSGVYRIEVRAQGVVAAETNTLELYPATNSGLAAGATGTIQIGGIQVEEQVSPSSYMVTSLAATFTRNEDKLSYSFGQLEPAAIYSEVYDLAQNLDTTAKHFVLIARVDESFGYGLIRGETVNPPVLLGAVKISGVNEAQVQVGQFSVRVPAKIAAAFALNDVNAFKDGAQGTTDTASSEPTSLTTMMVGCSLISGAQNMSGCIQNLKIAASRISDSKGLSLTA